MSLGGLHNIRAFLAKPRYWRRPTSPTSKAPSKAVLRLSKRIIDLFSFVFEFLIVAFASLHDTFVKLNLYRYISLIWGVILVCFGGSFALTIIAGQTFLLVSWSALAASTKELSAKYHERSKKLDRKIDFQEIVVSILSSDRDQFKTMLSHLMDLLDPALVLEILKTAVAGLTASIAAVKFQLSQSFATASSLASKLGVLEGKNYQGLLAPVYAKVSDSKKQWVDFSVSVVLSLVSFLVAWMFLKTTLCVNNAMTGAAMVVKYIEDHTAVSKELRPLIHYGLVLVGVSIQVGHRFALPVWMNFLLFPVVMTEGVLTWVAR